MHGVGWQSKGPCFHGVGDPLYTRARAEKLAQERGHKFVSVPVFIKNRTDTNL